MRIVILNGSPTGSKSVTRQHARYVASRMEGCQVDEFEIARGIRGIERRAARFAPIVEAMTAADGVLWSFPVYTYLVPAGMKRFIELLFERLGDGALRGKPATAVTTSAHFFDHCAHDYLQAVCEDLGMVYLPGYPAWYREMLKSRGRDNLAGFAREFQRVARGEVRPPRVNAPLRWTPRTYEPSDAATAGGSGGSPGRPLKVTLITDATAADVNVRRMTDVFCEACTHPVDVVDLHEADIKGGCLGCLRCMADGTCVYKDGYADLFDGRVMPADAVIWAATVRDRFLSSEHKTFLDRHFRHGHRPVLHGKAIGYLVSGPVRQLSTLRQVIEAKIQLMHSPHLGVVTDEESDERITEDIVGMARALDRFADDPWVREPSFLGVGGQMVFRDLVYNHKGLMKADHEYYLDEGMYDYPYKNRRLRAYNVLFTAAMAFPATRDKLLKNLLDLRLKPYEMVADRED